MDVRGLVLFLGCLACAFAAPLTSSTQCDTRCIVPSGFKEGRTYEYSYSTKTSTYIQGEQYGYSNLTVTCQARFEVIGTCEIVLELTDISVEETDRYGETITSPNQDAFRDHLTRNRLRFAMQAGKITSVCPQSDEATWATNFKRGILSALQLTLPTSVPGTETMIESTVSGTCETEVTAEDEESVTKTKDFTRCEDRYNVPWLTNGIRLVPQAPTSSLIVSEQHCRQQHRDSKFVTLSECNEVHVLKPVSDQESGPATLVTQTLTHERIIKAPSNHLLEDIDERKSILFEHHKHMEEPKTDRTIADNLISQLCESLTGGVDADTARLYPAILSEMRRLESSTLAGALAAATCEEYQTTLNQILLKALGECKSSGCIEIMVNFIQDGTIQDQQLILEWIYPLNFVQHPTKEMVSHLMQLAEHDSVRTPLYLAVSSIINRYCAVVNPDCEEDIEIYHALNYFEEALGTKCRYRDQEEKRKMVIAIHALGNAGHLSRGLRKCFDSESTDISLRVAAIQASAKAPCAEQNIQDALLDILRKTSQDSELRITAYKALMECPNQQILDALDNLLNEEESNQVGGYIVSHLKNIQSSQDPLKALQRSLLEDHPITAKCLEDPMKFSQNFELSWYNETTGYGLAGESDIIFSSNSFIPRQISVKGQVDALGYAFEAFELGGRIEGLQGLFETYFSSSNLGEEEEGNRQKRDLIKENKLEKVIEDFEVPRDDEADASIYLKIFGREMMFMDVEDMKAMFTSRDAEDYMMQLVMLAQGQTYETSHTSMLIEGSMSLPLVNGLELKFSVNGSSTDRFKASGKVDIMGMVMKPRSMEIDGTLEPSSAVDVSCLMEVDAHCARIGVNYEVSGHTATSLSGKISVEEGKNIQLKLRAPEQKQELISISSKVSFLHQEELDIIPSSSLELKEEEICTGEFLEDAIGMRVCGESKYHETPEGENPLSGAYHFSLTAQKVEADLESYDFEVSYNLNKKMVDGEKEETDMFHLLVGTPNTEKDRSYGMDFEFNRATREFSADLFSPQIDTVHVEGNRINTETHKRLNIMVTTNGLEYSLHYNFEKAESEGERNFHPTLRIVTPRFGTLQFVGSVVDTENQLSLDMSLQGESRQFVTISGQTTKVKGNRKTQYDTMLRVGGEYIQGGIQSSVLVRDGVYKVDVTLSKETVFGDERSVTIAAKYAGRKDNQEGVNIDFYFSCDFLQSPKSSFRLDGDLEAAGLTSGSTFKFCYGQSTCSGTKKIIISHNMDFEKGENDLSGTLNVRLQHPEQGTDLELSHHAMSVVGKRNFTVSIIDKSESVVLASARLGAEYDDEGNSKQGSIELSLATPGSIKRVNQSWVMLESGEFRGINLIQWQEDKSLETVAAYSMEGDTKHIMDVLATYPSGMTNRLHSFVDIVRDENGVSNVDSQVSFYIDEEERFYLRPAIYRVPSRAWTLGSVRVRTPFHILNNFEMSFNISNNDWSSCEAVLRFTQFPGEGSQDEEVNYVVSVAHEVTTSRFKKDNRHQMVITLPSASFTLVGTLHQDVEINEKKAGLSLFVEETEGEPKEFGIEGKVIHNLPSEILFRVNTTAPDHQNAVELTVSREEDEFNCVLDVEYFREKHLVTNLNIVRKDNGFTFTGSVIAPNQRAVLTLDHVEKEGLFNPHLTLDVTSFDEVMTLLDVDLELTQDRTNYGKNGELQLQVTGPGKTLLFSTGVTRNEHGFNYFIEVGNRQEVRLRIDLDTAVRVEGRFNSDIELRASSIYAPDWPVQCGIHLEQESEDQVAAGIYFLLKKEPLFRFNVSKNALYNDPSFDYKKDILVSVEMPKAVNEKLHKFGMHFGRELVDEDSDLLQQTVSLSFFWGSEPNQQLTFDFISSASDVGESRQVTGSVLMAQPLGTIHLQPEYSLDFSWMKTNANLELNITFNHDNEEASTLVLRHSEGEKDGNPNYLTAVMATAKEGKSFKVSSDVTPREDGQFDSSIVFTMDDSEHHEEVELDVILRRNSQEDLDHTLDIMFAHSPSGMDVMSLMSIRNSYSGMYFGIEGQCSIPSLESPLDLAFETEFDKTSKTLRVHALGPANDITVRGNVYDLTEGARKSFRMETTSLINEESKTLNVQVDFEDRAGDLILETDHAERTIHFGYLNDSSIQVTLNKDDHQNAQTTVTVLNPHTLYSLTTWDTTWPETFKEAALERWDEVAVQFGEVLETYDAIFQNIGDGFSSYMTSAIIRNGNVLTRMQEIKDGMTERLTEIKENYHSQMESVKGKFVSFREEARENLEPLLDEYRQMNIEGSSQIEMVREHIVDGVAEYFEGAAIAFEGYLFVVVEPIINHYLKIRASMSENAESDRQVIEDIKAQLELKKGTMREEIDMMRRSWWESKQNFLDEWNVFVDIMSEMKFDGLEDMKLGFQLNPIFSDFSSIVSEVIELLEETEVRWETGKEAREARRELMSEDLMALRNMKTHFRTVNNVPSIGIKLCQGELLRNWGENIKTNIHEKLERLAEWAMEQNQGYKFLKNVEEGRIELWLYTDQRYDDLISLPVNDPLGNLQAALGRLASDFPLLDDMRKYKSQLYEQMELAMEYLNEVAQPAFDETTGKGNSMNLEDLWGWKAMVNTALYEMLRFDCMKARAFLVGDQHYKTFDGTYYEFAGKCSFLLAQDFVDNTFTVAVEYEREEGIMSRSFVVIMDGVKIELHDNRVHIGRNEVELPYAVSSDVSITRDVNNIYICGRNGFTITYNLPYNIFKVELGILYFGKTAGLFGNFNHEPNDDLVGSKGNIYEHDDEFARSWEIGRKCTTLLDKASSCDISPTLEENFICAQVFLDGLGPASNGHPAVNPEPYYTMCANMRCAGLSELEFGARLCGIFQAYVQVCKSKGLTWIQMPKECNYCQVSEEAYVGPQLSLIEVPRGADVVIVLEQESCMSERSQQIIDLMDKVNTELRRIGYRDNRFGVVGFGGADIHQAAHVETIDGELFGPSQGLLLSLRDMPFDGEGMSDPWEAISFAMTYPFRAGVAKHVVFMACSECMERSRSAGSWRIQKAMQDQGIKFTMMMDYTFSLGEKSDKENDEIFGVDGIGVYTDKLAGIDVANFKGDPGLRHFVDLPNNPCTNMAIATEGALFSTNSMDTKKFKDVFALWVVRHSRTDDYAVCRCVEQSNGFTQSICE